MPYEPRAVAHLVRTPVLYPAGARLDAPRLIVEVGPGRGDFLFHLAETHPDATVVGIEIKRRRADKLILRAERRGLGNVCILQDDARRALPSLFAAGSVEAIHVHFPDPWPKKRHAKNRAVNAGFLEACRRTLKPGGILSIVTDAEGYAEQIRKEAATVEGIAAMPEEDDAQGEIFPSLFALKWRAEGRAFHLQRFRRLKSRKCE